MRIEAIFLCTKHTRDRLGQWFDFEPHNAPSLPCPLVIWQVYSVSEQFEPGKLYTFTVEIEETRPDQAGGG